MTTAAFRKQIASLAETKGRRRLGAFVAEGTKCVLDTLEYFNIRHIIATESWIEANPLPTSLKTYIIPATRGEIKQISSLTCVPDVVAVYDIPTQTEVELEADKLILALDRIQDPGNLGTIIRTADWMGIDTIIASNDTVDCFNPKVVQATMGAIGRVRVFYVNLAQTIADAPKELPVYGTFLNGENIYTTPLTPNGIIVMGNEGQGISPAVEATVSRRLHIPSYPPQRPTSESLNVGAATAIILSQFRSRYGKN